MYFTRVRRSPNRLYLLINLVTQKLTVRQGWDVNSTKVKSISILLAERYIRFLTDLLTFGTNLVI